MACVDFFKSQGLDINTASLEDMTNAVNQEGVNCINANMASCENACASITKTPTPCYTCLAQVNTCPDIKCRTSTVNCAQTPTDPCCPSATVQAGCCPFAKSAVQCGSCVSAQGGGAQTIDSFKACLVPTGTSTTTIIVATVVSVVGAIIIIVAIVVTVKLRQRAKAREKLVTQLRKRGVDKNIIAGVENIDYSQIESGTFKEVDTRLALNRPVTNINTTPSPSQPTVQMTSMSQSGFDL